MEWTAYNGYPAEQSIRLGYSWEEYESGKGDDDMFAEILGCEKLAQVRHITFANWACAYECGGCEDIVDWLVEHAQDLSHIESLCIGDMESEECELSWINQADYTKLWGAFPQLRHITIQGTEELVLGDIVSDSLESIEIICGGLPTSCIRDIERAKAPNLKKINLYLGVDNYGFDAGPEELKNLLANSHFPALTYLGLCNSEIATEVAGLIAASKYAAQIETLDISKSVFTDASAQVLLDNIAAFQNLKKLDLSYHYLSDAIQEKLRALPLEVDLSDPQGDDEDEDYRYPMFTE